MESKSPLLLTAHFLVMMKVRLYECARKWIRTDIERAQSAIIVFQTRTALDSSPPRKVRRIASE